MTTPICSESDLREFLAEAQADLGQARDEAQLEAVKVAYLGRKGRLTGMLRALGRLDPGRRPAAGKAVNQARRELSEALRRRRAELREERLRRSLEAGQLDVSLPGRGDARGARHPISLTMERILDIFAGLGFGIATGPEVEDEHFNFEALNIPPLHPARAMHDTFYLERKDLLLRTHTSPMQIRYLQHRKPPLRFVAPGRVYRRDADATHSPMFHQVEGMVVDEAVSMADLKGLLEKFLEDFFGPGVEFRLRPSYFPFTEPSAEVDIRSASGAWLEVLGCGLVHPRVLENCGVDTKRYNGLALGLGVERLAMLSLGILDLRSFFDNDQRFLAQFRR